MLHCFPWFHNSLFLYTQAPDQTQIKIKNKMKRYKSIKKRDSQIRLLFSNFSFNMAFNKVVFSQLNFWRYKTVIRGKSKSVKQRLMVKKKNTFNILF